MGKGDQRGHPNSEEENKKLTKEFFQIENPVKSYKTVKDHTKDIESHQIEIETLKKDNEAQKSEIQAHKSEIDSMKER